MKPIKKTIYTLNIDDYAPEITALTYPLIELYAKKIGADFHIIKDRKYPNMPVTYEKLQIRKLAEEAGNDWSMFIDSDALIHPDTIDFTTQLNKNTVMHNGADMANIRWFYDEYFLRDGRNIGSCNWLALASDWCLDLWNPLDIPLEDALNNIHPTLDEVHKGITREHLIDDYTLSRNIAKHGLKFTTALDLMEQRGIASANFFYHQYTIPVDEKIIDLRKVKASWGI